MSIDPGLKGALAFYDPLTGDLEVFDMPTHSIKRNNKSKNVIDLYTLARIVDDKANEVKLAVVEDVYSMPGQGVSSVFSFGFSAGCAQMVVAANFIKLRPVSPQVWKKAMRVTKDKDTAFREASRLMPQHSEKWMRKRDDGRAEAALMAYYAAGLENKVLNMESML